MIKCGALSPLLDVDIKVNNFYIDAGEMAWKEPESFAYLYLRTC